VRPPVSLEKLLVEEGGTDTVVYRAAYSDYFHTDTKVFPAIEFLVELLQHLPDSRSRLLRTYGLYSARARGTWARSPHLLRLAPEGWKRDHLPQPSLRIGPPDEPQPELTVSSKHSRAAWAPLIKKVYEADPLTCPRGHNPMNLIAVITERQASHSPVWIAPPSTDLLSVAPKGSMSLRYPYMWPSSALSPPDDPEVAYLPIVSSSRYARL